MFNRRMCKRLTQKDAEAMVIVEAEDVTNYPVFDWLSNIELPSGQESFKGVEVRFQRK